MENQFLNNIRNVKKNEKSLPELVSEQIRQLIIDQHMEIGSKLPNEYELCQQLNVGRGTVREAVKLLVARNVLEIQRGRGTFIANNTGVIDDPLGLAYLDDEERLARELFQIRMQLEPWIAELAAISATDDDIKNIKKWQTEVELLLNEEKNYLPADQQFHISIANCTKNRILPMLIPVVTYSVHLFGKLNQHKLIEETIETHRSIVAAIETHDSVAARAAMKNHLALNIKSVPALTNDEMSK
jgi:DNA-binding FadR family transcriptional regulator